MARGSSQACIDIDVAVRSSEQNLEDPAHRKTALNGKPLSECLERATLTYFTRKIYHDDSLHLPVGAQAPVVHVREAL
jgi:hypothetical protein